jgi:hypothetical protein
MKTENGMRLFRIAMLFASVSLAPACTVGGASDDENTGTIDMSLQLGSSVVIDSVNWTISNATTGYSRSSTVNTRFSNSLQFLAGAIPAGIGYEILLTATSTDGAFSCTGSASFTVSVGAITPISLTFNCSSTPPGQGGIVVVGTTQVCANLDSLGVSPLAASVDAQISLSASASAGSLPTSLAWTATAGTFDDPSSATPTFTCPSSPGPVTITVVALPSAATCPNVTTQSVTVACEALDPTFTNVYSKIIGVRCIGCHKPASSGVTIGMLDMSTPDAAYSNLVGVSAQGTGAGTSGITCASSGLVRVVPGNAATSLLFNKTHSKLLGVLAPCGSPMPAGGTSVPLTAAQVDLISRWIDGGAVND